MGKRSGMVNANEIAKSAALEALKIYKKEEKDKTRKAAFHNTGLLLENFLGFIEHYENIRYKASDIQDELDPIEYDMVANDDIIIYSIKRSKIRTKVMIRHIETAVKLLEIEMAKKGEVDKITVFRKLYMDPAKKDYKYNKRVEIVEQEMSNMGKPCSQSTIRRWANDILEKLSVKLFGVDGLKLDI